MTPEQQVAYIMGQVASALIEMEAMKATNQEREHRGESPAYGYDQFMELQVKYCVSHNAIISYFYP